MPRPARTTRTRRLARLLVALGDDVDVAIDRGRRLARTAADGPRGERLAILDHRERVADGGDRLHESWVLRHVLGWSERDAAKALDCSRTVLRRHLAARPPRSDADERAAIDAVRRRMDAVFVSEVRGAGPGRIRGRGGLLAAAIAAVVLATLAAATAWLV